MILSEVLGLLERRGGATLSEIASAVHAPADAVELMLGTLQRRGLVRCKMPSAGCGSSCTQCTQKPTAIYLPAQAAPETADAKDCAIAAPARREGRR